MTHRRLWLVCYDIADDRRRRDVHRTLRGFGDRLQQSVFRCLLSSTQKATLVARLDEVVKPSEDRLLMVPLGKPEGDQIRGIVTLGQPVASIETVCRVI